MKTLPKAIAILAAIIVSGGATALLFAEEKEKVVSRDQVPVNVLKTIDANAKANDATVGEITQETEDGKVVYEAEATRADGSKLEIEVGEDGKLIEIEVDEDEDEDDDDDDDKKAAKVAKK
jgi:hypothetical protein